MERTNSSGFLASRLMIGAAFLALAGAASGLLWADAAPVAPEPDDLLRPDGVLIRIDERFGGATSETPDFQRHVSPLLGRLGCNGRACHGSFQGQGGFQLSLFGYYFAADHKALTDADAGRVNVDKAEESLILKKPTLAEDHDGGERFKADSWAYRVLRNWIAARAPTGASASSDKETAEQAVRFVRLAVTPAEIDFKSKNETIALRAVAEWSDGSREDVTPLCRFRTNDESIATVSEDGVVTSVNPGNTHIVAFYDNGVTPVQVIRPVSELASDRYPAVPTPTKIDELVVAKLRRLGIVPSDVATDAEFLRRVRLDMTGTLPAPAEVEAFLADTSADKRTKKIEELLATDAYAAWWTTKLCDITGNNPRRSAEPQLGDQQARGWYDWIYRRVKDNVPYDQVVQGIVLAVGRREDQSYADYCQEMSSYFRKENPADFSQRETMPYFWSRIREGAQPKEKAMSFSYAFLGVRLACAECHKHPFDQWTKDDFDQFTAFFQPVNYGTPPDTRSQFQTMLEAATGGLKGGMAQRKLAEAVQKGDVVPWREVFVAANGRGRPDGNRPNKNKNAKNKNKNRPAARVVTPKLLGDDEVELARNQDPRAALMDWMREKDNPYFARAIVNRIWASYFNVGIIEPPDDMNLANPASNEPLLDYLTAGFIENKFDLKWVHRQIAGSRTYQLSWKTNDTNRLDERNFSHAVLRRLPAEVAYDAIVQATAADEKMGPMQSDFSQRAIGHSGVVQRGNANQFALRVFGKPERATNCDCERSAEPSLLQALFLRNDQDVLRMIDRKDGWLNQVSREVADVEDAKETAESPRDEGDERRAERISREIRAAQRRLDALKKDGDVTRAMRARRRLERLRAELRGVRDDAAKERRDDEKNVAGIRAPDPDAPQQAKGQEQEERPAEATDADLPGVGDKIRVAYMRTLSRPPTAEEEARIREHLKTTQRLGGLRDTIWALLNSKEFILNH